MIPAPEQMMQASSSAAASDAATELFVTEAESTMSLDAMVMQLDTLPSDVARDIVSASQTLLKGNQPDIRKLCKPCGSAAHKPEEEMAHGRYQAGAQVGVDKAYNDAE